MIEIHMEGALSPIRARDSYEMTQLNMSAAARNDLIFFGVTKDDGRPCAVAIRKINYIDQLGDE